MHRQQRALAWLNVVGGLAVVSSYAVELAVHPEARQALWGGVPAAMQPLYTASMLLAAVGYFPFTVFLVFRVSPEQVRIAGRFGFHWFIALYALILVPSALWMPLTFRIIAHWDPILWLAMRSVLLLVACGSAGLLAGLLLLTPRPPALLYRLAIAGAAAFCMQTVVLDAVIWPAFFPTP